MQSMKQSTDRRTFTDRRRGFRSNTYEVMFRLMMPILVLLYGWVAFLNPKLFDVGFFLEMSGILARVSMVMTTVLCLFSVLDVLVNDVLPAKYKLTCGIRFRQPLWMAIGLTQVIYSSLLMREAETLSLGLTFLVHGLGSISVAFLDAGRQKVRR